MEHKQKRTYKGLTRTLATETYCANGHEWKPETTYYPASGQRKVCRICQRNAQQRYHARPETEGPIGPRNGDKTHCPKGHPYEKFGREKNDGSRFCTICHRFGRVRRTYGLEPEQWDALVLQQEGRCDLCGAEHGDLHVDHDHVSGAVRGLLCGNCNNGLGRFFDNIAWLHRAGDYVEAHRARGKV